MTAVRVVLPAHLKNLARVDGEVTLHLGGERDLEVTRQVLLDALESAYPVLLGTIRDRVTGSEPFLIVGAMAGG